jgi:hypothetical protein
MAVPRECFAGRALEGKGIYFSRILLQSTQKNDLKRMADGHNTPFSPFIS